MRELAGERRAKPENWLHRHIRDDRGYNIYEGWMDGQHIARVGCTLYGGLERRGVLLVDCGVAGCDRPWIPPRLPLSIGSGLLKRSYAVYSMCSFYVALVLISDKKNIHSKKTYSCFYANLQTNCQYLKTELIIKISAKVFHLFILTIVINFNYFKLQT